MAVYDDLKSALRAALLTVFGDVRLEKTAAEGAEQVAEAFREAFDGELPHLGQIEALTPQDRRVIMGNGAAWVLGDPCDCVAEHTSAADPHPQYMRAAAAVETFAPADHAHAYEAAGTMDGHLLAADPHPGRYDPAGTAAAAVGAITPASIGAAPAEHTHPQYLTAAPVTSVDGRTGAVDLSDRYAPAAHTHLTYQSTAQKGQPNGYAALDSTGRVPAAQLPAPAYACTVTTASVGPMSGTAYAFAGAPVAQLVPAEGITYQPVLGRWTVVAAGVYEVAVMLPLSLSEAGTVSLIVAGHELAGLAADTQRRPVAVTVLRSLAAGGAVDVLVGSGGTSLVTVGAGATVTIRRIA